MCQTTTDATIKVAEADITVYKILDYPKIGLLKRLFNPKSTLPCSSVQGHVYEKGITQPNVTVTPKKYFSGKFIIEQGYHSFEEATGANSIFMIPKGTKYVQGIDNRNNNCPTYVSETIVFVGKIPN